MRLDFQSDFHIYRCQRILLPRPIHLQYQLYMTFQKARFKSMKTASIVHQASALMPLSGPNPKLTNLGPLNKGSMPSDHDWSHTFSHIFSSFCGIPGLPSLKGTIATCSKDSSCQDTQLRESFVACWIRVLHKKAFCTLS